MGFGTAVAFDVVNRQGDYVGGIIAPGLAAMTDYLHEKTALLPRIKIREVRSAFLDLEAAQTSVEVARGKGLTALTVEEFFASPYATPESFDSMLAAHLVEHLTEEQSREILASYLPYVRPGGLVVFITPQERGYASDATHVKFMDFAEVGRLAADLGLTVERGYSFPFPRLFGRLFTYNEFVVVARKP